jgi:hypothetical protein
MKKHICLLLAFFLIAGQIYAQADKKNTNLEAQLVVTSIDKRISMLKSEIPELQKKLIQSRKEYQELLNKVPKGYRLMCADTISSSLEDRITRDKADLKSLQKERKRFKDLSKPKKTEQGAAANP